MTHPPPDNPQRGNLPLARWVKSSVVGEEPAAAATPADPEQHTAPAPMQPISDTELAGARWFAIAFLVVMIPLGLVLLGVLVWEFISNIRSL